MQPPWMLDTKAVQLGFGLPALPKGINLDYTSISSSSPSDAVSATSSSLATPTTAERGAFRFGFLAAALAASCSAPSEL